MMMAHATNGTRAGLPEAPQTPHSDQEIAASIAQYERIAISLSAFATALDIDPEAETKAVPIREFAKLIRANIAYVRNLDGIVFHLNDGQHAQLEEIDETLDDLIDTLEWATEKKAALLTLVSDANRTR